jgi:lipoprotein-releasing system permease protein
MSEPTGTRPFAPFEWMLSLRYLRARRKEGFISVIAGFSFLGIMLGVATLIIVMAVMNGFRKELFDKILGLNGHLLVQPLEKPLTDFEEVAARGLPRSMASGWRYRSSRGRRWRRRRSMRRAFWCAACAPTISRLTSISKNIKQGTLEASTRGRGS